MGIILRFERLHATAPAGSSEPGGYKSGLSSDLETPVARSMGSTNSPGTPFFERKSQYQTCDCVVPIRSAKGFWPPAASQARLSASTDMRAAYPELGSSQLKTLSGTGHPIFGSNQCMRAVDKAALGHRVRSRREKLKISQTALAEAIGVSQQGIHNIESGSSARPRSLPELAEALATTQNWLLYGEGQEQVQDDQPENLILQELEQLNEEHLHVVLRFLRTLREKKSAAA